MIVGQNVRIAFSKSNRKKFDEIFDIHWHTSQLALVYCPTCKTIHTTYVDSDTIISILTL